jgi:hypothetical protein
MWSGHSGPLPLNLLLILILIWILIPLADPDPYFAAPLARVPETCCRMNCCTAFASIGCEK